MATFSPRTLDAETLCFLHDSIVEEFSGTDDAPSPGVRDRGLLESASTRPLTSFGATDKYVSAEECAAAIAHSVINNHPFLDGNKRTALMAMVALLDVFNIGMTVGSDEAYEYTIAIATHRLLPNGLGVPSGSDFADQEVRVVAHWLASNSTSVQAGDRTVKFRQLERRVKDFDGWTERVQTGNRINFCRKLPDGRVVTTQTVWNGSGSMDVTIDSLKKIRSDLELTTDDGVDSRVFYDGMPRLGDLFVTYRSALKKLAEYDRGK
jgi:death-on-curing family protein